MYDEDRLEKLVEQHVDGVLSSAARLELEEMLRASPLARESFWRHVKLSAAMRSWGEAAWGASVAAVEYEAPAVVPAVWGRQRRSLLAHLTRMLRRWSGRAAVVAVALIAAAAIGIVSMARGKVAPTVRTEVFAGGYDDRAVPVPDIAISRSRDLEQRLSPTTLRPRGPTRLRSTNGALIELSADSVVGLANAAWGALYSGSVVSHGTEAQSPYSILTGDLRIVDRGADFRAVKRGDLVEVSVEKGAVEVESRIRLPVALWSFDSVDQVTRRAASIDDLHGLMLSSGVVVVDGAVGTGSLRFDNSLASYAVIDGGTGPRVGDGTLAASLGISIEALVKVEWSGSASDNDAIFRKEDGQYNVLLAFQNDSPTWDALREPAVEAEQCLSFGLHLAGRGYRELDMPLDGREGRPSLASLRDGRFHHLAATYDSFSGRKCIYVDGVLAMEWEYPRGTIILSGGPAPAFVGSSVGQENFTGGIDEVAIYDFALTAGEIAEHASRARDGKPYFEGLDGIQPQRRWRALRRLAAAESGVFDERRPSGG